MRVASAVRAHSAASSKSEELSVSVEMPTIFSASTRCSRLDPMPLNPSIICAIP